MDVAIIDYKMSNLFSVQAACNNVGLSSVITSDNNEILDAKIAILPGVGAFGEAMKYLSELKLDDTIFQFVDSGKPFVGICLGLQLLFDSSDEFGANSGLGLVKGKVKKFKFHSRNSIKYPVPQIGWNMIKQTNGSWNDTLLCNNDNGDFMYFVHSYYVEPQKKNIIVSSTTYGNTEYCSSVQHDNIFACQFHPEKSGDVGLNIYKNLKKGFSS
ncbi:MAG: imidazole glycerol phosphate synthase subunit HisH [Bacteroidetes bacterium]|jgi:imidazole glycerol-phosphate synthase subunit HisH|nr:imidazole glycerol phosphate synthase subunit HisH [Bacteroidota bacterium]